MTAPSLGAASRAPHGRLCWGLPHRGPAPTLSGPPTLSGRDRMAPRARLDMAPTRGRARRPQLFAGLRIPAGQLCPQPPHLRGPCPVWGPGARTEAGPCPHKQLWPAAPGSPVRGVRLLGEHEGGGCHTPQQPVWLPRRCTGAHADTAPSGPHRGAAAWFARLPRVLSWAKPLSAPPGALHDLSRGRICLGAAGGPAGPCHTPTGWRRLSDVWAGQRGPGRPPR